jgi:xanthine dehydrogenase accessory factor
VTIVDARERFARSPRFARAAEVVVDWPAAALAQRELGPRDAVLVFTHDPKFDVPALVAALATGAGYVGALGSRRTTADRDRRLREAGVAEQAIARIHAPCGLDIGGRTPGEVAISVLAEMVAERTGRPGAPLRETSGTIQPREPSDAA